MQRVVVTGAGFVTPLGIGWTENAAAFREGRSAFREITLFDASRQRVRIAAEVTLPEALPRTRLGRSAARRVTRAGRLLLHAAAEALESARWNGPLLPMVLGTTSGGMALGEEFHRRAMDAGASRRGQVSRCVGYQPQRQALEAQEAFGFRGPVTLIANACSSGANAIGHGWALIRGGRAERVLAGGYEALCHMVFAGFDSLQALSPRPCRPFDAARDGLSLGEGAAVFMLESLSAAERRGASILGEVIGYGTRADPHHLTQPHPEGRVILQSMRDACDVAGIGPEDVGYVNAHGTGTVANDSSEAAAISAWAGSHAGRLPVSSTKASVGHLLGAAGAVEFGICLMALAGGWLPPMRGTGEPDPGCRFRLVREPEAAPARCALSNSIGFGGANASLVVRRWS